MIAIFPEIVNCAASRDFERLAICARRYFAGEGKSTASVIDVESLIEAAGLEVIRKPLPFHGALVGRDHDGAYQVAVFIDEKITGESGRVLLAHLLGHYLLHWVPVMAKGDFVQEGFKEQACPRTRILKGESGVGRSKADQLEFEADQFAMCLLLPLAMIKRASEKLGDSGRVGAFFGVSSALVEMRVKPAVQPAEPKTTEKPRRKSEPQINAKPPRNADPKRGMERLRQLALQLDRAPKR